MPETLPSPSLTESSRAPDRFPAHVTRQPSARVFGLDALRAAAISFVLIAEGIGVLIPSLPWWSNFFLHGGYYGVELFFVLSGFLIGTILIRAGDQLRQPSQVATFYLRRWFRTLPLFLLFIVINVCLEAFVRQRPQPWSEIWRHTLLLANFSGVRMTFIGESWSLAVEEWFYFLFPLALFLGLRLTRRFDRVLLAAALAFFLFSNIGRMITAGAPHATWPEWQRKTVILRFDGLMLGVFAAWIAQRYQGIWQKRVWLSAAVGLILLAILYASLWTVSGHAIVWSADNYFARTWRFTLVSLGFALLLPAASTWTIRRENLLTTSVRRIALWSYALYLVHTPLNWLVQDYVFPLLPNTFQHAELFILQIGGSILVSALLYRFFESRCTHLRDRVAPAVARTIATRAG